MNMKNIFIVVATFAVGFICGRRNSTAELFKLATEYAEAHPNSTIHITRGKLSQSDESKN